jgi:TolB-like protein/Flp pilus assembly protein TadD
MLGVTLTQRGKLFGTPAYMAPEQLRGERADAKTDQYSFCVALFQGLYGQLPFTAESPDALLKQMEQRTVASRSKPSHVPSSIHKVLLRGLSPAREDRYESLDALLRDLTRPPAKRLKTTAVVLLASILTLGIILTGMLAAGLWRARERSPLAKGGNPPAVRLLAVLPLENQTGDAGQEFYVDGMTDALITRLAQVSALQVTSKQSVLRYKAEKKSLPAIARELGVGTVVTGSVARSGNQVHIDAQLVDAASGRRLWSRSYDRDLSEVSVLQSEIASSIAEEIQTKMTPQEQARLAKARAVNPPAYEAYLRGRFLVSRRSVEEAAKALKYFQEAIDIDPDYAPAYAGLCDSYVTIAQFSGPKLDAWEKGKAAASRALELDETLAEAHRCRAMGLYRHEWDWVESEKEYQRALQLNPGDPDTYRYYSNALALRGRANEAIAVSKRGLELDPLSAQSAVAVAFSYYFARQYDRVIEQARRAVELDPTFIQGHRWLGLGYAAQGKFREAIDEFKLTVQLSPANLSYLTNLALLYAWAGKETEARQTLAQVRESKTQFVEAWPIGLVYVALGDKDEAFPWMDKAYEEHSAWLLSLRVNPWVDPLRSDPRFDELVRRVEATAKLTPTSKDSPK